jgi:acetyl esterase/lipase
MRIMMRLPNRRPSPAATALAFVGLLLATAVAQAQSAFYTASDQELAGAPGTIIRAQPMRRAPDGAIAYRVLYRSTGLQDLPIAVSGVVVLPAGPVPAGGRPIVAWAHPTTGALPHCAPSLAMNPFKHIQGLDAMLARGYAVAATDYPGLGTPGPHPYLVGVSEARAVIDSVRATRDLEGANADHRFAVWGHSQGGHAALFTGILAKSYAPELELAGVAAAAPATELATLMAEDLNSAGGRNLTAMTLWSWQRVFDAPMARVLTPAAIPIVDLLAQGCIESIFDIILRERETHSLVRSFLSVPNPLDLEPWKRLAAENTPGTLPRDIPVFLSQGADDRLVRPPVTKAYMESLCGAGSSVHMVVVPKVNHAFIGRDSAAAAVDWMADRFAGEQPPTDCGPPL